MSPLAAWKARFNVVDTFVPENLAELDILCSETEWRVISHIGIELANCCFNSPGLQALRRSHPFEEKLKVQIKYNPALLARIWVTDPRTNDRIEVLNSDPQTADLSVDQVAALEKLRRGSRTPDSIISRQEARSRLEEIYRPLLNAKTQAQRRRAFKLLGIQMADQEQPTQQKHGLKQSSQRSESKKRQTNPPTPAPAPAHSGKPVEAPSIIPLSTLAPRFEVIRLPMAFEMHSKKQSRS